MNEILFDENGKIKEYFKDESTRKINFYGNKERDQIDKSLKKRSMWKIYKQSIELILKECTQVNMVLDVGCGIGNFIFELNKKNLGSHIIGVDFLKEPLSIASERNDLFEKVSFFQCDAQELCFKNHSVDLIFCFNVLHHMNKQYLEKTLLELSRITKNMLVLEIRNKDFIFDFFYQRVFIHQKYLNLPVYSTELKWLISFLKHQGFVLTVKLTKTNIDCLCRRMVLIFKREKKNDSR